MLPRALALAFAAGFCNDAAALFNDRVEVFAQENITYDSNVYRLSTRLDPVPITGSSHRNDTVYTTSVGALLNLPVSLQRFNAGYTWFTSRYDRFSQLDYNGHVAFANWQWALASTLNGEIGYTEQETISSFSTFLIPSSEKDLVTVRGFYANGAWLMTPRWRAHAGVTAGEADHSSALRDVNDLRNTSVELGMSYVTPQENRIGVAYRGETGKSPHTRLFAGVEFDNKYRQNGIGVQGRWVLTGLSRLDARADYTRREYDQFTNRNYSGPTFRATYTWTPTGKLTIATTAQRDVAPLEDIQTTFVLVTGISVKPSWAATDKITVRGNLDYSKWDYRGDTSGSPGFHHRVRNGGVVVLYRLTPKIQLSAGASREVRASSLDLGDYRVNTVYVEGRIGF
jgi:exopolysaccharide biosynthesis operon protein EpsL